MSISNLFSPNSYAIQAGTLTAPVVNARILTTDTINSSDYDHVLFTKPMALPNNSHDVYSPYLNHYSSLSGICYTSGCINTILEYKATRIGSLVNICIQCLPKTSTAITNAKLSISKLPIDVIPRTASINGLCLVNSSSGIATGSYEINTSGEMYVYADTNNGNFMSGLPCGLASVGSNTTSNFATFTFTI